MLGKKRKNTWGSHSDDLIYADTLSGDAAPKTAGERKRRMTAVLLSVGAVLIIVTAVLTVGIHFRDRQDRYDRAGALLADKEYAAAGAELEALGNYRDSQALLTRLEQQREAYDAAMALVEQQRYDEAITAFRALGDYADSAEQAAYHVTYQKALDLISEIDVGKTQLLTRILTEQVRLTDENSYPTTVGYEVAAALLESLGDYKSAPALMDRCYYSAGLVKLGWKDWDGARAYMENMTAETAVEFYEEYEQRYNEYAAEEGH